MRHHRLSNSAVGLLVSAGALMASGVLSPAQAGCSPAATAGNDIISCDAVTLPNPTVVPIDLLAGTDQLTVLGGTYSGGITGGAGTKTIVLSGGTIASYANTAGTSNVTFGPGSTATITGDFTTGARNDRLEVHGGTISGAVNQGDGVDTFIMTNGTVQSLTQGGGLDTAVISGGRIVGLFFAGDFFTMTGGRIGDVNLEQANNEMRMSGGTIDQNVRAAQGNDLFELSGGTIGGFVNLGSGNNTITVTGGFIGGGITTTGGNDTFLWSGGGTIVGPIDLGGGTDSATLRNLTGAGIATMTSLNGGLGNDTLTFDNTTTAGVGRFINWETIALTNGSRLTLDGNLTLGDTGTLTGAMTIDATSTLIAGGGVNPVIQPFAGGSLVTVTNAGTIDLTTGPGAGTNSLTIVGNYVGQGGRLLINTYLGSDNSPSDKLVISNGTASGTTGLVVNNIGGPGGSTVGNGILVVEAINGATTATGSFGLTHTVAAGAYEYFLFRGGVTPGLADNYYLRSQNLPGSQPLPPAPVPRTPPAPPAPPPTDGTPAPPPAAVPPAQGLPPTTPPIIAVPPSAEPIPIYRVEVPVYSAVAMVARQLGLSMLGTFHERTGDQSFLRGGDTSAAWGRVFGMHNSQRAEGSVAPSFDGTIAGFQTGFDALTYQRDGVRDKLGLFFGYGRAAGDVSGFALAQRDLKVGRLDLDSLNVGGYWTRVGPSGWYIDSVVMGSWLDGRARSDRGIGISPKGAGVTGSIESGLPMNLGGSFVLEPQAQLIVQRQWFDATFDTFSTIGFSDRTAVTGRVGVRLQSAESYGPIALQPYLKANFWHDFAGSDGVIFGTDLIETQRRSTAVEVGGGFTAKLSQNFSAYAAASYIGGVGATARDAIKGNFGFRIVW
ncbi:pertactin autotransporter precursor [Variibacter gotjawalensis]|uniref:Pertactin autotransporter n=1 Tax=Variibacter gotjawalensis TaxID=1333996 RepID=A0A0S3PYS2_9BRAD|nr:autotransporter outer membrane beta-barrel domain-containing protein [Variibacter gotjawalensis]NIK46935.1 outer membrane autotransporter protein [Variibacter gotjawalensis]RZS48839.1 outer membrane autotransporter protein [Variibacter gotjawalensis]BAT61098.1 pertactin autotransporter precursor [Variibacter gotjawalensis]